MGKDTRINRLDSFSFYHTIELPNGTFCCGEWDHRDVIQCYGIPESLHSQTAIDVGCRDGFFTFELERRGAKVTALDIDDRKERRFLTKAMGSKVIFVHENIYEFWRSGQKFDLVMCCDVIVHVESPLKLLRCLHQICKGKLILVLDKPDDAWVNHEYCKQLPLVAINHSSVMWHFNNRGIEKLLNESGWKEIRCFSEFEMRAPEQWRKETNRMHMWKMCYHAVADPEFNIYDNIGGNCCDVPEAPLKKDGVNSSEWTMQYRPHIL